MTISTIRMTAEQFLALGRDPPGVRLELVDGEIAVSPSPTPSHAYTVSELWCILWGHVKEGNLGVLLMDVDVVMGEHDVRRPDLLFFTKARRGLVTAKRLSGKPDLAVEVASPGSKDSDARDKFRQYAKGGIRYYWMIDPEDRTFAAYGLKAGRYVLLAEGRQRDTVRAEPFPDLEIPLGEIWWPR